MSYRKRHIKKRIYRTRPKKSILKKAWFWLSILAIFVVLAVSYLLLFFSGFQVSEVIVSGNEKIGTGQLEKIAFNDINKKIINLGFLEVKTSSIFLLDANKLSSKILDEFAAVKTVNVEKKFFNSVIINITERDPIGAYCDNEEDIQECFLIDGSGIIFEKLAEEPSGKTIVRQIIANEEIFAGKKIVSENIIKAIIDIQKCLKDNYQIELIEVLITSPLRLNTTTSENWEIYFNLSDEYSIAAQLLKLDLLLKNEILNEDRVGLQYIDLRFKDRAFYK